VGGARRPGILLALVVAATLTAACNIGGIPILPPGGSGQIYVADGLNNRIIRMNDMTGAGWTTFGTAGRRPTHRSRPPRDQTD
jgi:hypothetical protein